MSRRHKMIIICYLIMATILISVAGYMNNYYMSIFHRENNITEPSNKDEAVTSISFSRTLDVDKKNLYDVMADVEDYPKILPQNYLSVNVINRSDTVTYAEEEVTEKGIKLKLLVKHTFVPYEKHALEVLDGDARGTKIVAIYEDSGVKTKLTMNVETHLRGILQPFGFFTNNSAEPILDPLINKFVEFAKIKRS